MPQSSTEDDQHDREGTHCIPRRLVTTSDQFATADGTFLSGTPCALTDRCSGLIFGFEIEFDRCWGREGKSANGCYWALRSRGRARPVAVGFDGAALKPVGRSSLNEGVSQRAMRPLPTIDSSIGKYRRWLRQLPQSLLPNPGIGIGSCASMATRSHSSPLRTIQLPLTTPCSVN